MDGARLVPCEPAQNAGVLNLIWRTSRATARPAVQLGVADLIVDGLVVHLWIHGGTPPASSCLEVESWATGCAQGVRSLDRWSSRPGPVNPG